MAITFVGAASAQANSIALPAHQTGDLIIISAGKEFNPTATTPAGWRSRASTGNNGAVLRSGFKIAQSDSEVSGTWTGAVSIAAAVYRSNTGMYVVPGQANSTQSTSTSISYTLIGASVSWNSWFVLVCFTSINAAADTPPTGSVNRTSSAGTFEIALHDDDAYWSSQSVATASCTWATQTLEIYETNIPISSGGGTLQQIIGSA